MYVGGRVLSFLFESIGLDALVPETLLPLDIDSEYSTLELESLDGLPWIDSELELERRRAGCRPTHPGPSERQRGLES